jgi:hypothetical protein
MASLKKITGSGNAQQAFDNLKSQITTLQEYIDAKLMASDKHIGNPKLSVLNKLTVIEMAQTLKISVPTTIITNSSLLLSLLQADTCAAKNVSSTQ